MLIEAVLVLVDEIGLERFSIRVLAQRIGVFPSSIYWYFPTYNWLLAALVNHCLNELDPQTDVQDWKMRA